MNIDQLKKELSRNNINPQCFSIGMPWPVDGYCLDNNNGNWEVFYVERGEKHNVSQYNTESDACDKLLELLLEYPIFRLDYKPTYKKPL